MKLDIGCGGRGSRQAGFIGIDIWPLPAGKTKEEYYQLDFLTATLPWKPGTVDQAISLHMIEHLMPDEGHVMLQRTVELLKPGAHFTVTCPDLMRIARAYVEQDHEYLAVKHLNGGKEIWPGETLADRFNWAIHQETHKWAYDADSLWYHIREAVGGKVKVSPMELGSKYNTRPGLEIGFELVKV